MAFDLARISLNARTLKPAQVTDMRVLHEQLRLQARGWKSSPALLYGVSTIASIALGPVAWPLFVPGLVIERVAAHRENAVVGRINELASASPDQQKKFESALSTAMADGLVTTKEVKRLFSWRAILGMGVGDRIKTPALNINVSRRVRSLSLGKAAAGLGAVAIFTFSLWPVLPYFTLILPAMAISYTIYRAVRARVSSAEVVRWHLKILLDPAREPEARQGVLLVWKSRPDMVTHLSRTDWRRIASLKTDPNIGADVASFLQSCAGASTMALTAQIRELSDRLGEASAKAVDLQGQLENTQSEVGRLRGELGGKTGIEKEMAALSQRLQAALDEIKNLSQEITELSSLLTKNIDDAYELVETIAVGGMGEVQKRRDKKTGQIVAVKLLKAELSQTTELGRRFRLGNRFRREIEVLRRFDHPNIVRIYDWGIDLSSQRIFYVMEFINNDAAKILSAGGQFGAADALHIILEAAKGLQATAHQGIVHRDIKPENLLVTPGMEVKVSDFGTAHVHQQPLTELGSTMGTPGYMSPEQLDGQELDLRADIFSLGVVFYFLLTRKQLFLAATPQASVARTVRFTADPQSIMRQIDQEIEQNPGLARIIKKMLAPNKADRYQNYESLLADLAAASAKSGQTLVFGRGAV